MTLPYDEIMSENSAPERAVLLSDRSQQFLLLAMDFLNNRTAWDETTDMQWDDIQAAIDDATFEIIEIVESGSPMSVEFLAVARITSTQSIPAATPTAVIWNTGSGYDAGNNTRLAVGAGNVTINANVHFTSAIGSVGYVEIVKNGGTIIARQDLSISTVNYVNLSAIDVAAIDDYYELLILVNQASTLQFSTFTPQMKSERIYSV